jgi:hypothetical protein
LKYRDFGTSCDILGADDDGRLIVAEAKPSSYRTGIVTGPIQVRFYAGLISRWLELDPKAPELLHRMLDQRIEVGLSKGFTGIFQAEMPIVPVLAIGDGDVSDRALAHAADVRQALASARSSESGRVEPMEIWLLRPDGNIRSRR